MGCTSSIPREEIEPEFPVWNGNMDSIQEYIDKIEAYNAYQMQKFESVNLEYMKYQPTDEEIEKELEKLADMAI